MTAPACKALIFKLKMNTFMVIRFNFLEFEFCKLLIAAMAVNTVINRFHPQFARMRKLRIIFRMAVGAAKAFMIGQIELISFNNPFRKHQGFNLPADIFIGIFITALTMAFKASFIFLTKRRNK